jgi:hypothetical protein
MSRARRKSRTGRPDGRRWPYGARGRAAPGPPLFRSDGIRTCPDWGGCPAEVGLVFAERSFAPCGQEDRLKPGLQRGVGVPALEPQQQDRRHGQTSSKRHLPRSTARRVRNPRSRVNVTSPGPTRPGWFSFRDAERSVTQGLAPGAARRTGEGHRNCFLFTQPARSFPGGPGRRTLPPAIQARRRTCGIRWPFASSRLLF